MAGVNFEKIKATQRSKLKGIIKHNDKNARAVNEHKNKHIDKTKTSLNFQLKDSTVNSTLQKFERRLAEVADTNKRKDRVEAMCLEVPIPDEVTLRGYEEEKKWVQRAHKIISEFAGKDNVVNVWAHFDERHAYIDAVTKADRMSLNHLHYVVVPEINGKLNGKEFSKRERMIRLNNELDEMSLREFGVRFQTGTRKKSKDEVESLKQRSKTAEIELKLQQTENLLLLAQKRENELNTQVQAIKQKQEAAEMLANEYFEKLEAVLPLRDMLQDAFNELNKIMTRERARMTLDRFEPTVQSVNKALEELGQDPIDMGIDDEEIDR